LNFHEMVSIFTKRDIISIGFVLFSVYPVFMRLATGFSKIISNPIDMV